MQTKNIKPLVFCHLTTNDEKDIRICLKRRPKYGKSFTCNLERNYRSRQTKINPAMYVKISKHIKVVQEVMLNRYYGDSDGSWGHLRDYLCKISKNLSKVKTLFLEDSRFAPQHLVEWLNVCLRYSKQIKRIDTCITDDFDGRDRFDERLYGLFSRVLRKTKLQALNLFGRVDKPPELFALAQNRSSKMEFISHTSGDYAEEISFKPDNMRRIWIRCRCREIATFEMCWKWENEESQTPVSLFHEIIKLWASGETPQLRSSISGLSDLVALQIDTPITDETIREVLESFPNLPNLIGLKISEGYSRRSRDIEAFALCPQLLHQLPKIAGYPTILTLDLTKGLIPIQDLTCLLKENALKKLGLNVPIQTEDDIDSLISLTQTLKDIKVLSFQIPSSKVSLCHPKFGLLLNEISDLKGLTKIELVWTSSKVANRNRKVYSEKQGSNTLSASLERLLSKQPQLESLRAHFMLKNQSERYPLLKSILQRAEELRKLDIDVRRYLPNEVDLEQIGSLLKNLKRMEVLRLEGFDITKDQDLVGLVKEVRNMPKLRKLKLGTVTNMTFECIWTVQKSLFSFSSLQQFNLATSPDFAGRVIPRDTDYIDEIQTGPCRTWSGYVRFYRPYETETDMEWQRLDHDVYKYRRGQGAGRGGGRYHVRGRPRISWFR